MGEGSKLGAERMYGASPAGSMDPKRMRRALEEELRDMESKLSRSTRSLEERLKNRGRLQENIVVPPPIEMTLPSRSLPSFRQSEGAGGAERVRQMHEDALFGAVSSHSIADQLAASVHAYGNGSEAGERPAEASPSPSASPSSHVPRPFDDLDSFTPAQHPTHAADGPSVREVKLEAEEVAEVREGATHVPAAVPHLPLPEQPASSPLSSLAAGEESFRAIAKRRHEKEEEYERELRCLQAKLRQKAAEKMQLEEMKAKYSSELLAARQDASTAKRGTKEVQMQLVELQKRLNSEMAATNRKDEELQNLQRKFPTMLRELELATARNADLLADKEDLLRQLNEVRKELQQLKEEAHSNRQHSSQAKADLEQNNQRLMTEVFDLNSRLTESVLLVSELRGKRDRDSEERHREAAQQKELRHTIEQLRADNEDLRQALQSHSGASDQLKERSRVEEQLRRELKALKASLAESRAASEAEVADLKEKMEKARQARSSARMEQEERSRLLEMLEAERARSQELQQVAQSYKRELQEVKERRSVAVTLPARSSAVVSRRVEYQESEEEDGEDAAAAAAAAASALARKRERLLRQKEEERKRQRQRQEEIEEEAEEEEADEQEDEAKAVPDQRQTQRKPVKKAEEVSRSPARLKTKAATPTSGTRRTTTATPTSQARQKAAESPRAQTSRTPTTRTPISIRTPAKASPARNDDFDDLSMDEDAEEQRMVEEQSLRSRLYTAKRGDDIDILLAKTIRSKLADGLELLPPNFERISKGVYRFGTKKVHVKIMSQQPVVRVGGGFMTFTKFVKKFGRGECVRISKTNDQIGLHHDSTSPVHKALHRRGSMKR